MTPTEYCCLENWVSAFFKQQNINQNFYELNFYFNIFIFFLRSCFVVLFKETDGSVKECNGWRDLYIYFDWAFLLILFQRMGFHLIDVQLFKLSLSSDSTGEWDVRFLDLGILELSPLGTLTWHPMKFLSRGKILIYKISFLWLRKLHNIWYKTPQKNYENNYTAITTLL